jgi:hypothetical protein
MDSKIQTAKYDIKKKMKVLEYIIDETLIKVGYSEFIWL